MRRAFITILLLLMPTVVFGQTSTVSGHVVYGSNSPVPSKAQACFSLQNFKPNLPRLSTGVIVTNTAYCITPAADGSFTTPIARNDFITPAGTYWRVDYMYNGVQSSSANFLINKSSFNLDVEIPVNPTIIIGPSQLITQSFLYQQASPSSSWTVTHNLSDTNLLVEVFDLTGKLLWPDTITNTDANTTVITFVSPTSGRALLIHAGTVNIATNQPNAVISNPSGPQTISGSLTVTGTTNLQGGLSVGSLDNTIFASQQSGADASIKINAAIIACLASLTCSTVDARGLGGVQTISQQINVGNSSQRALTLLLPNGGDPTATNVWNVTITDGTSCAIQQYSSTTISSQSSNINQMVIKSASAATNVKALYCTNSPGGGYYRMDGVQFYNPNGATMATAAFLVDSAVDDSTWQNVTVASYNGIGVLIQNSCCGATFREFTIASGHGAGGANAIPLKLGNNVFGFSFFNLSAGHPGVGLNNIISTGIANVANFYNLYMESNNSDTTTPLIQLTDTASMGFYGIVSSPTDNNTAYVIKNDVTAQTGGLTVVGLTRWGNSFGFNGILDNAKGTNYQLSPSNSGGFYTNGNTQISGPSLLVQGAGQYRSKNAAATVDTVFGAEAFAPAQGAIGTVSNHPFGFYSNSARRLNLAADGGFGFIEQTAPAAVAGSDVLTGDSVSHALKASYNGDSFAIIPRISGSVTAGHSATWLDATHIQDGGVQPLVLRADKVTGCSTGAGSNSACKDTLTWSGAGFSGTNYSYSCSGETTAQFTGQSSTNQAASLVVDSRTATTITVTTETFRSVAAQFTNISCVGVQ